MVKGTCVGEMIAARSKVAAVEKDRVVYIYGIVQLRYIRGSEKTFYWDERRSEREREREREREIERKKRRRFLIYTARGGETCVKVIRLERMWIEGPLATPVEKGNIAAFRDGLASHRRPARI